MKLIKYHLMIYFLVSFCGMLEAQTQQGFVKTLGRPDRKGAALSGVTVRVSGFHNPVISNSSGTFSLLLTGKKNGEAFSLQEVNKKGYELNESDVIGRQFAYSDRVPLTIVMVSTSQLQADKQRIENNAYEVAQRNYKDKLTVLEGQLTENKISEEQYHLELLDIQDKFEKYQLLIDGMAEHYAHVDYDALDEKECEINLCIENGELERADSLISLMFNPLDVLKRNKDALARLDRQISDANTIIDDANAELSAIYKQQEKDASHLYQLYTIALSRFDNDKAKFYIETRAELDTTNIDWQTDAGNYLHEYLNNNNSVIYAKRALRNALSQYGRYNYVTVRCMSNLITKIDSETEKFELVKQAFEIMDSIGAYDNTKVRNALYTSLGTMAHTIKEDSLALTAFSLARDNIEAKFPNSEMLYSIYNNIGSIQRSLGDYKSALEYYNKALIIAQSKYKVDHPKIGWSYERIGGTFFFLKKYEESQTYLEKAYLILQQAYGDSHPKTQDLCKHMGASSYAINDWGNVESYLSKVIPELQKSLRISHSDSTQHDQISKELELYLSVIIKALEKLDKVDKKMGYMHQLYDIKCVISKSDISMFNITNELGKYHYERDEYFMAKNYFVEAYKTLCLTEDTSYRRNSICNNLYYTYMELFKGSEALHYKNEYMSQFWPSIDIALTIDEGETPASALGMQGRYHLLKFEDWDYKSLIDIFEYNKSLIGCPKHITVEKDGTISSYYFEDTIGANIEIKYMDSIERSNILNKYETLKGIDYEIY